MLPPPWDILLCLEASLVVIWGNSADLCLRKLLNILHGTGAAPNIHGAEGEAPSGASSHLLPRPFPWRPHSSPCESMAGCPTPYPTLSEPVDAAFSLLPLLCTFSPLVSDNSSVLCGAPRIKPPGRLISPQCSRFVCSALTGHYLRWLTRLRISAGSFGHRAPLPSPHPHPVTLESTPS